ncbi:MAG: toll/interleukin-1 receptor domain-containing protein [Anaerolineae bacterium]|nr:toll/interleukin-1 receptor domain-containing protein [Anaerolineae bacterium]MBT7189070.1 toll/interleukin-1 receptor domain-containing protein [Anaerolineae bacterium]MBT7990343.1 toll/interleukin-1 receptor domain-containing protein [Anaerolineae bacterium]
MSIKEKEHIFVSYSRRDDAVMRRIVTFLRGKGFGVWVDNEELIPGTPIWEVEIEKAIRNSGAIVALLSPNSNSSVWVRREISFAEEYQKRIFPVMVSGNQKTALMLRLITNQYVDCRGEKEDEGIMLLASALGSYLQYVPKNKQTIITKEFTKKEQKKEPIQTKKTSQSSTLKNRGSWIYLSVFIIIICICVFGSWWIWENGDALFGLA